MNQQAQPLQRVHHFYVTISKCLFQHPEKGIVSVQDPIRLKDAKQFDLSPLILYGVNVAGLPVRWMTFTPFDQPRALREVLQEAWRDAAGLRGRPEILRISRYLAAASPELIQDLAKIGVQVEVAAAKDPSLPESQRSAEDASRGLLRPQDRNERSLVWSIQALCRGAQNDHDIRIRDGYSHAKGRMLKKCIQQWLALPMQVPELRLSSGLDWKPGPWLSFWEHALPRDQNRYFKFDAKDGRLWLLKGEKESDILEEFDKEYWDVSDDEASWAESDDDNAAEIAKNLVACWPNPMAEIAKGARISLRKLQWHISGKSTLVRPARVDLDHLLGIEYDENIDSHIGAGPYVLVAHEAKAIKEAYESIAHGGTARSCEIVPSQGEAEPNWRIVFINRFGEIPCLVMAARGAKITDRLPSLRMNYDGIRSVSPDFYWDVVSTCARACRNPAANIREMKDFATRYRDHWKDYFWLPE